MINMAKTEEVTINIYNILGEKVKQLFSGVLEVGQNQFSWDGMGDKKHNLSSGNYFVVAKTFDNFKAIKLILLK
jgi:flagellar hook assembly protein FlgD